MTRYWVKSNGNEHNFALQKYEQVQEIIEKYDEVRKSAKFPPRVRANLIILYSGYFLYTTILIRQIGIHYTDN